MRNFSCLIVLLLSCVSFSSCATVHGQVETIPFWHNIVSVPNLEIIPQRHSANAIFEGGSVRVIALAGALYAAEEEGFLFSGVGGSSAGALIASLYAAGYRASELADIIGTKNFLDLVEAKPTKLYSSFHVTNLMSHHGYFKMDRLYSWIKKLLAQKGVQRFKDLPIILKITASDILHKRLVVFSNDTYPDMEVAEAVCMSCSIPFLFRPMEWFDPALTPDQARCLLVDGSLIDSYPADLFKEDSKTQTPCLGFRLIGEDETRYRSDTRDFFNYAKQVVTTAYKIQEERLVEQTKDQVTHINIHISDIDVTEFDISKEDRTALFAAGYTQAKEFLKEWKGKQKDP